MKIATYSNSFTRPNNTTAYAANRLIANTTTAGSVLPLTFSVIHAGFVLTAVSITHTSNTTSNAIFNLNLYTNDPVVANGDGATWSSTASGFLGTVLVDCSTYSFSDHGYGLSTVDPSLYPIVTDTDQNIYGLLTANAAYAPAANEIFTVTLIGLIDL